MKLDEASCSTCGSSNVSTKDLALRFARILSKATRRIFRVRMKCKACGASFWHLHTLPRTVVGYHGCSQEFAMRLVDKEMSLDEWQASESDYDWLGEGIYFWEYAPGRAWQWAHEHFAKAPAVVATEIKLGTCLDLGDTVFTSLLRESYNSTVELYSSIGREMPRNEGIDQKLRRLDNLVINRLIAASKEKGVLYQTVRCPFEEGGEVYEGGKIREQSHVQIAVRDKACISRCIFLVPTEVGP